MTDRAHAQPQSALTMPPLKRATKADSVTYAQTRAFVAMDRTEKIVFVLKVVVFFCCLGYVFPRLFSDGCEGKEYGAIP